MCFCAETDLTARDQCRWCLREELAPPRKDAQDKKEEEQYHNGACAHETRKDAQDLCTLACLVHRRVHKSCAQDKEEEQHPTGREKKSQPENTGMSGCSCLICVEMYL